ncbi:MAG: response regulator transcription factor [Spirochaetales bacterium]|nr:response regulator transcription factor [Spirochaetales bacterium]
MTKKIFVVEDHTLVVAGIQAVVSHTPDFEVCGHASSISEAYHRIGQVKPDIVILDIGLKNNENGFALLKKLNTEFPAIPVLVLSMHEELDYVERALQQGATGYLLKGETADALISAIRTVLKKEIFLAPSLASKLLGRMFRSPDADPGSPTGGLTDREFEIFTMLGQGMTAKKISKALGISTSTVDTHRNNIKLKLGLESNSDLIRQAVKWSLKNEGA